MSRLVSRILLSIFMFPLAGVFFIFITVAAAESSGPPNETGKLVVCGMLTWLVIAAYWCLLWRTAVQWNSFRILSTIFAAFIAAIIGTIVAFACTAEIPGSGNTPFGAAIGGSLTIILWLIATVFFWRESAAERAQRIKRSSKSAVTCPTCGYNLTGLSESRCPECGAKFTLDELIALQTNSDKEIE